MTLELAALRAGIAMAARRDCGHSELVPVLPDQVSLRLEIWLAITRICGPRSGYAPYSIIPSIAALRAAYEGERIMSGPLLDDAHLGGMWSRVAGRNTISTSRSSAVSMARSRSVEKPVGRVFIKA